MNHVHSSRDKLSLLSREVDFFTATDTTKDATLTAEAMHLPDPALTLTIPSIHDGTVLDCRVYHPLSLATALCPPHVGPGHSARTTGRPNAAIVAHPYAPLGGSYDDPIVEDVAGYLLTRDFVVGTFNFRCVFYLSY